MMGGETRLSWLPAGSADRERYPHTQHTGLCPRGVRPLSSPAEDHAPKYALSQTVVDSPVEVVAGKD